MTMLMNATKSDTMSSREIAELTGKEHKHVKRDCEVMFAELEIDLNGYAQKWTHPQNGQTYTEYLLTYELVQTLITGYSIKLRHKVIQRLNHLEGLQTPALDLNNPEHLRNALLGYTEKVIALEHQVEVLTPKAAAHDRIADSTGLFTIRESAKTLKIKERDLVALLLRRAWAYRDSRNVMQPYAEKVAAGYVTSVVTKPITGPDGQERVFSQLRITAKGVARLAQILAQGVAA